MPRLLSEPGGTAWMPSQRSSDVRRFYKYARHFEPRFRSRTGPTPRLAWPPISMKLLRLVVCTGLVVLAAGCAVTPGTAPAPSAPAATEAPRPGQPPPNVLAAEVTWMKQLFEGTPVAVAAEPDGSMRVDVPLGFSFDDKSNSPKPPLRAVMDRVATSMARQASAKVHLATPGPVARGAAMRSYLQGRGVIGLRVVVLAPAPGDAVTLRVVPGPIAIDKLDDSKLPPPTNAFPRAGGKPSS